MDDASLLMMRALTPGYDVVLSNISNKIELGIIYPKLAQSLTSSQSLMTVQKETKFFGLVSSTTPNGMILLEGKQWKCRRRLMSKVFNHNFLMSHVPSIAKICGDMTEKEEKRVQIQKGDDTKFKLDLEKLLSNTFGKIVVSLFLGTDLDDETIEGMPLEAAMREMSTLSMRLCFHPLVIVFGASATGMNFNADCRRFNKIRAAVKGKLRELVGKIVEEKKSNKNKQEDESKPHTMIGDLIDQLGDAPNLEETLADEIYIFTIGGQDSTAALTISTLFYLFQHPQVLQKLRRQINEHTNPNEPVTAAQIKELRYAELVVKEAGRLDNSIPFILSRTATEDVLIGDIPVKKGTGLNYLMRANFFDSRYFDQPFEFRPERLEEPRYQETEMRQIVESTFSAGPRTCIGKHLAHLESKILLVKFLERYSEMRELQERVFVLKTLGQFERSEVEVTKVSQ